MASALYFTHFESPVGTLELIVSEKGLKEIHILKELSSSSKSPEGLIQSTEKTQAFTTQLQEYFEGKRTEFDLPLDLEGTAFQKECWGALIKIPFGTTQSYSDQAKEINNEKAVRAVGQANGRNPVPIVVPCHRVIAQDGGLGGFSCGLNIKKFLLAHERKFSSKKDLSKGKGKEEKETKKSTGESSSLVTKKGKVEESSEEVKHFEAGLVVAVCSSPERSFSKATREFITLLEGLGVEGDAHCGVTMKHKSRAAVGPEKPNLRQVHLIHSELHDSLREEGFHIFPGQIGENITTRGIDLLSLPKGARLHIGGEAIVEITGLRNPCFKLDKFQAGLKKKCLDKAEDGSLIRKAGVMSVVPKGGVIRPGDVIHVELPQPPFLPLQTV